MATTSGCIGDSLNCALSYLLREAESQEDHTHHGHHCEHEHHHHHPHVDLTSDAVEPYFKFRYLHQLLCVRPPRPPLPEGILADVERVTSYVNDHRLVTDSAALRPSAVFGRLRNTDTGTDTTTTTITTAAAATTTAVNISVWRGSITDLAGTTTIVNAANAELLGCFRPAHRCIDNVIHAAAGPRLRASCDEIMEAQGHSEPVGLAKVTPGFCLRPRAAYIVHTVGPQLDGSARETDGPDGNDGGPTAKEKEQLASCYESCLDAADGLPPLADGRKVVVFCCISTGLFAFPAPAACQIALETVVGWLAAHPHTTLTDVVFDTFMERDWELYNDYIANGPFKSQLEFPNPLPTPRPPILVTPPLAKAKQLLDEAEYLLISAGAGLSAAVGLDYTSTALFKEKFPAFGNLGLEMLYDVFGFSGWESPEQKWGYIFTHLNMALAWPVSPLYQKLRAFTGRFASPDGKEEDRFFVRTSNADMMFARNGFPRDRLSTPQGQYAYLQCFDNCRPDAVFPSQPYIDAALPLIDPRTQTLTDPAKVPVCPFCGGTMTMCVRGGDYFNNFAFRESGRRFHAWQGRVGRALNAHNAGIHTNNEREQTEENKNKMKKTAVILELGVGLNTPSVLRWANEQTVAESSSQAFRLVRAGVGPAGCLSPAIEEKGLGVGIEGDLRDVLGVLLGE